MFRIIKAGAGIGLTENLNYIKKAENGCYILCPEHDASGIVFEGVPGTAVSYDALSRRVAAEEKNGKTINETEIKEILCKVEPMVSLRSLNETMKLDGETERQEMVTDPEIPTPDEEVGDRLFLASCLEQLTPRERQVIAMRYGLENCERMTLMEIGGKLHITKERVRQLEQRAMEKMRAFSRS